jgi:small subunit ribosomal protein S15
MGHEIRSTNRVLSKVEKTKIVSDNAVKPDDTGSPEVQVALLSERIALLTEHLNAHKKDFSSRVGLLRIVGQRKRVLAYLKKEDAGRYESLIKKLNLRK